MMEATVRLGRIRGIEVGLHYSWFIIFIGFSALLAEGQYPDNYPDWSRTQNWAIAIASVSLLFLSVLLHEFGHALVAQNRGVPVRSITLFIFGGVASLTRESDESGDEFLIAIAGPVVSIALGGMFYGLYLLASNANDQLSVLLGYLALINVLLVAFNMIPALPLDGGRVLRAVLWRTTGDMRRATRIASFIGVGLGMLFILVGIVLAVSGAIINGIWTAVIGWFLQNAAEQSRTSVERQDALQNIYVRDLMHESPVTVSPDLNLTTVAEDYILSHNVRGLLVVRGDSLVGIITVADLKRVGRERWSVTTVRDVMTPASEIESVDPDDDVTSALNILTEHNFHQVPVLADGKLAGIFTRNELVRYLQTRRELGPKR